MDHDKPIIFMAFANDRDDRTSYLRNLAEEARQSERVLEPAEQRGLCQSWCSRTSRST